MAVAYDTRLDGALEPAWRWYVCSACGRHTRVYTNHGMPVTGACERHEEAECKLDVERTLKRMAREAADDGGFRVGKPRKHRR